jgi:hypothetical protein
VEPGAYDQDDYSGFPEIAYDMRAIARAQAGDIDGAIADFRLFIDLLQQAEDSQYSEAEQQVIIADRESVITSLQEGDNLFVDEETLARMRESMYMQDRGESPFAEEDEDAADENAGE